MLYPAICSMFPSWLLNKLSLLSRNFCWLRFNFPHNGTQWDLSFLLTQLCQQRWNLIDHSKILLPLHSHPPRHQCQSQMIPRESNYQQTKATKTTQQPFPLKWLFAFSSNLTFAFASQQTIPSIILQCRPWNSWARGELLEKLNPRIDVKWEWRWSAQQ